MNLDKLNHVLKERKCLLGAFQGENHPDYIISELKKIPSDKDIDFKIINKIIWLKRPATAAKFVRCVTEKEAVKQINSAYRHEPNGDIRKSIDDFCQLKHLGLSIASAFLSWRFPEKYPVIDRHAWRSWTTYTQNKISTDYTKEDYFNYIDQIIKFCKNFDSFKITPQKLDFFLYANSRVFLGKLSKEAAE